MPTKLNYYTNYIHSEFIYKEFDWQALRMEGKYDRLFGMFNYLRPHENGICHYYPLAGTNKIPRNRPSKDNSRSSNSKGKNRKMSSESDRKRGNS